VPNLRHDPDAAVVVTEVWQLFVSEGSAAFGAVDTAFGAWHGGHSLCGQSFWTQPLWPQLLDTAFAASAFGHSLVEPLRKWRAEVRIRSYSSATFIDFDSFLLQAPKYLQVSNDTQDVA